MTFTTLLKGTLKVCTYGGFAPVCYWEKKPHEKPHLEGLDVSFLREFARQYALKFNAISKNFDGIWTLPGKDECDIAGAGVMKLNERHVGQDATWSDPYYEVKRSLLVRAADKKAFDDHAKLSGKKIVVTRGSTADIEAKHRYPKCEIQYVDMLAKGKEDAQEHIVKLLLEKKADAFNEGDVSNDYLSAKHKGLAVADVHAFDGPKETFNFIARNKSGVLAALNDFIARNKAGYKTKKYVSKSRL